MTERTYEEREADRCRHCGRLEEADGDHNCPCPYSDADCPDHPRSRNPDTNPKENDMSTDVSPLYELCDKIDALLNDCSQIGPDEDNFVRVSAVRALVREARRDEEEADESIRQAAMEEWIIQGGHDDPERSR